MRRSRTELYVHCVWTTRRREPQVTPSLERRVYQCIQSQAQKLGCTVLALNGMPDHVHLLVRMPSTVSMEQLMHQVQGFTARVINQECGLSEVLHWQEGSAAFSLSRSHVAQATAYIKNQKQHHADNDIWDQWEWTEAED